MIEISVLLPVRDAGPYLGRSLASLRRQTFSDFEIVAVDDGSTDGSGERLERAARREPRLRVIRTGPRGLPAALNSALAAARGRWIARHDADDLSRRDRLRIQSDVLVNEPGVAVVGSRVLLFPSHDVGAGMRRWCSWHNALLTHEAMANEILIDSTLVHGTAMFRRRWLEEVGGWKDRPWAEDVDLWLRLLEAGAQFAKSCETLYAWRQHSGSATRRDPRYRRDRLLALKRDALERVFLRQSRTTTLVGVGQSLQTWRELLAPSHDIDAIEAARPNEKIVKDLYPPMILVFGAASVRMRWREYLIARGMIEGESFIFVA